MTKLGGSVSFLYRDFYDVPRMLVCIFKGEKLLLDSPFDDALDDYSPDYYVYALPIDLDIDHMKSWVGLASSATRFLGKLPVSSLQFDMSKRGSFESDPLVPLLEESRGNLAT